MKSIQPLFLYVACVTILQQRVLAAMSREALEPVVKQLRKMSTHAPWWGSGRLVVEKKLDASLCYL